MISYNSRDLIKYFSCVYCEFLEFVCSVSLAEPFMLNFCIPQINESVQLMKKFKFHAFYQHRKYLKKD